MARDKGGITGKALQEFLSEAQEIVEQLGSDVLRLEEQSKDGRLDPDLVNATFRAAHSLKGLSGMFGVDVMNALAHRIEDLLDGLRMGRVRIGPDVLDLLFESVETLNLIIAEVGKGHGETDGQATETRSAELIQRISSILFSESTSELDDPLVELEIDPQLLKVLTEYEEHRLRENVSIGANLYMIRVSFDLMTFDKDLGALTDRVKKVGEVISTLPSGEPGVGATIDFDLLVGSEESLSVLQDAISGLQAKVEPIGRREAKKTSARGKAKSKSKAIGRSKKIKKGKDEVPKTTSPLIERADSSTTAGPNQVGVLSVEIDDEDGAHAEVSAAQRASARQEYTSLKSVAQTVRVNIDKLDYLMTIVGDLVLSKTNLQRISDNLKETFGFSGIAVELYKEARNLERRLDELQQGVIEVRMVPLGQVFDKLSRMVRKMAREEGKEIRFEVSGGETELDKLIMEDLSDPLMHLIRNAIDHGIEPPEERQKRGKPSHGMIRLAALQKGNHVTIEVQDDGAGMDEELILNKALEKGLLTAGQALDLSRRDILNLIFVPGFSTSGKVTGISGRGVGMDVVKTNISSLSGVIDVASEVGVGSTFALTLPITLAIIQALVIRVAGHTYAVPLNGVTEILRLEPGDIRTVERQEVIDLRGATLPLVRLEKLFGLTRALEPSRRRKDFVVVVGLAQNRIGVAVDELVGQHDVVIKSLGKRLGSVRGIAGATDLGDHRTTLVIDVAAIIEDVLDGDAGARAG